MTCRMTTPAEAATRAATPSGPARRVVVDHRPPAPYRVNTVPPHRVRKASGGSRASECGGRRGCGSASARPIRCRTHSGGAVPARFLLPRRRQRLSGSDGVWRGWSHLSAVGLLGTHGPARALGAQPQWVWDATALQLPRHPCAQDHQAPAGYRSLAPTDPCGGLAVAPRRRGRPGQHHLDERRRQCVCVHLRRRSHRLDARRPGGFRHRRGQRVARGRGPARRVAARARGRACGVGGG